MPSGVKSWHSAARSKSFFGLPRGLPLVPFVQFGLPLPAILFSPCYQIWFWAKDAVPILLWNTSKVYSEAILVHWFNVPICELRWLCPKLPPVVIV